jgi:hypothetical protein
VTAVGFVNMDMRLGQECDPSQRIYSTMMWLSTVMVIVAIGVAILVSGAAERMERMIKIKEEVRA